MTWDEVSEKWFGRLKLSPWLAAYIFLTAFAWTAANTFFEQRSLGGTYADAFRATAERLATSGPTPKDYALAILFWAGLLWFTFLSKSKRVTEDDKRFVRLWTAAMVLLELAHLVRHVVRAL
jgi:hypothetical protein